jgi:predicted branched-subunit amino acid permease
VTGSTTESSYRDGARAIAPIVVAAAAFGGTFGVLAREAGIEIPAALTMSATTFAGSAQFAVASVFDAGGGIAAAIAAAVFLNARYAPISVSVAPAFGGSRLRRLLESQLIVDESWAVSRGSDGSYERRRLVGAGLVLYAAWVGGTTIGAVAGEALGDPERLGLDAAFPALFLALLAPQVRTRRAVTAAFAGGALALALVPFAPAGVPIVAASAACMLGWSRA